MIVVMDDLPVGGAKRVVFEQIKGLVNLDQVAYFTNNLGSQFDEAARYATQTYCFDTDLLEFRGGLRLLKEWSYLTKVLKVYRMMAKTIAKLNPKVVIVHPSRHTQAPQLLTMLRQPTIYYAEEWPRVVYEPNMHPLPHKKIQATYEIARRWGVRQIDYISARSATKIVANSSYMAAKLQMIYDRKVEVIHPGVDSDTFYPAKTNQEQDYFLFIGEKEEISGYQLLKHFKFPVKVVNFKKGGFRYSDRELADLYRGAIATLCLAENEPFGLTAIESMACGTPVIAVDSGGYKDTVINNQTGIVIHLNEVELNQAATLLTKNKPTRQKLGQAGLKQVKHDFLWKGHIEKLIKIIDEVTND